MIGNAVPVELAAYVGRHLLGYINVGQGAKMGRGLSGIGLR